MTAPNDSFSDLALATAEILTVGQEVRGADLAERIKEPQLRPFRVGGRCCTRLVTTRIPDLLPVDGP